MKKIIAVLMSIVIMFTVPSTSASACFDDFDIDSIISKGDGFDYLSICDIFRAIFSALKGLFNPGIIDVDPKDYTDFLFELPGLDDDFVPQGMCFIESINSFAVSGYLPDDEDGNERFSRIYLINAETNESKALIIDGYSGHAGGIASHGDDVWISSGGSSSSNGTVYHLGASYINSLTDGDSIAFDGSFKVKTKGSFLYCSDDTLWVGEFYSGDKKGNHTNEEHHYGGNHSLACGYSLPLSVDYSLNEAVAPDVVLSIPDKAQGMSINKDGKVIFSTSYGRRNDSTLWIFDNYENWEKSEITVFGKENIPLYISGKDSLVGKIKMPTLMEGIDYHNNKLYIIYESGAKLYSDAKEIHKNLWETDIDAMI